MAFNQIRAPVLYLGLIIDAISQQLSRTRVYKGYSNVIILCVIFVCRRIVVPFGLVKQALWQACTVL